MSQPAYRRPATLGIHYQVADYQKHFLGSMKESTGGLLVEYTKGISRYVDWTAGMQGSFPDSMLFHRRVNEKVVLIQPSVAVRLRAFGTPKLLTPFVQAGIGGMWYRGGFGGYLPLSAGVELQYKDVYVTISSGYSISLTRSFTNHAFYSIGISGLISRQKHQPQKPVAVPVMPTPSVLDRDGDGIPDREDACPDTPGVERYKGCPVPDRDRDGINDEEDLCPDVPGLVRYHGCPVPDTDADGVNDEADSCMLVAGVKENKGCPLRPKVEEKIAMAARRIFFKTGSSELLAQSFPALDEVVVLLKEHPEVRLLVEGHTDNQGKEVDNQVLSERRAGAVVAYLAAKGIAGTRLRGEGFGQTRPLENNETKEGRAVNRRVEMRVW